MSLFYQNTSGDLQKPRSLHDAFYYCVQQTFLLLSSTGQATEAELEETRRQLELAARQSIPGDILQMLARVQGTPDDMLPREVTRLAGAIGAAMYPSLQVIPFSSRLMIPSQFYGDYPALATLARVLAAPVIYAEDIDAIGTGAVNPVAAEVMAEEIVAAVGERRNIRPFVTAVRMDYDGWMSLTRKHFSL